MERLEYAYEPKGNSIVEKVKNLDTGEITEKEFVVIDDNGQYIVSEEVKNLIGRIKNNSKINGSIEIEKEKETVETPTVKPSLDTVPETKLDDEGLVEEDAKAEKPEVTEPNIETEVVAKTLDNKTSGEEFLAPVIYEAPVVPVKVVEEKENKNKGLWKAATLALTAVTIGAIIICCRSCGKTKAPTATPVTPVTPTPSITSMMEDSRYTEITEDSLVKAATSLQEEFKKCGIEITNGEALQFVAVANITHIKETNPELLVKVFGDNPDAEVILANAGHTIGRIVTVQMTKGVNVDYTIVFLDEQDKEIAQGYEEMLVNAAVIGNDMTKSVEDTKKGINDMIEDKFVNQIYNYKRQQEDGAAWVSRAIVTAKAMDISPIKDYLDPETKDDLNVISYNENTTPNIMIDISGCKTR